MNLNEAISEIIKGHKVKLPEWSGYWFMNDSIPGDSRCKEDIKVLTKDGDILNTPWFDKYKDREDFEVTVGCLGYDFAVRAIKNGKSVSREGWGDRGIFVTGQFPDEHSKMTRPYMFITIPPFASQQFGVVQSAIRQQIPYTPSQTDMFSEDWFVCVPS